MYLWSLPVYVLILYTFVEHEPHIPENWSWANKELNQTSKKMTLKNLLSTWWNCSLQSPICIIVTVTRHFEVGECMGNNLRKWQLGLVWNSY